MDISRPLSAQSDCFWWGYQNFSKLSKPYYTFTKIVRGYEPLLGDSLDNIKNKTICSLFKAPLTDNKVMAGLFNDSGEILDLFESKWIIITIKYFISLYWDSFFVWSFFYYS